MVLVPIGFKQYTPILSERVSEMALFFYALKHQENKTKFWISPGAAEHTHKKTFISKYKAFRDFDVLKMQQDISLLVTYMRLYCQNTKHL